MERVKEFYPHIYKKLMLLLGNQEALNIYIDTLMVQEREDRMGFDEESFKEIIELSTQDLSYKGLEDRGYTFN